jgi:hypothetical protein
VWGRRQPARVARPASFGRRYAAVRAGDLVGTHAAHRRLSRRRDSTRGLAVFPCNSSDFTRRTSRTRLNLLDTSNIRQPGFTGSTRRVVRSGFLNPSRPGRTHVGEGLP